MIPTVVRASRYDGSLILPLFLAVLAAGTLLAVPFPQNADLIVAGASFVVAAVNQPLALGVLVASVPMQDIGREALGPVNLTLTKVALLSIAISWGLRVLTERRAVRLDRLALTYALYVLVLGLTIVNAPGGTSWGPEMYRWWSPLLAYVIATNTLRTPNQGRWIIAGTAAGVAGVSLHGISQVVRGVGPESFNVNGLQRAYATFGQPNPFAGYLGLTVPFLVALVAWWLLAERASEPRKTYPRGLIALAAVGAGLGLVALILTQSRGGWLGTMAGLAAVAWLLGRRIRLAAVAFGVVALLAVVATPYGARLAGRLFEGVTLQSRDVLVTPENFAVQERLAHWRAGLAMAKRYPYLGVGAGNFSARYREFTPVWRFRISRGHAHNAYVHVAAQSGFLGLGAYLLFCAGVASRLRAAWRAAGDGPTKPLVVGAIGVSVAFAVHNVFDYLHVLSLPVQLAAIWALAGTAISPVSNPVRRPAIKPSWRVARPAAPYG